LTSAYAGCSVRREGGYSVRILLTLSLLGACLLVRTPVEGNPGTEAPVRFLLEWGRRGTDPGEFDFPIGIAIGPRDEVYVTDHRNARVQKFSPDGKFLAAFDVWPYPGGIAVDRSGHLYLSNFGLTRPKEPRRDERISVYDGHGKLLRAWGKTGTGAGEFDMPGGVAIAPDGRVYVADQTNRRVQVFDPAGKFLLEWGEYGTKPGQFGGNVVRTSRVGGPQFLALDSAGHVYTTEASVGRVQVFTREGKFLRAWGDNGTGPGGFGGAFKPFKANLRGPIALCIDAQDRVWVSSVGGRVQQFTRDGKFLRALGTEQGSKPGQFLAPHGVAVDRRGHLYVVDAYNHRIQKFATPP
jgi:sugar lactone lactonase YvrE